MSTPFIGKREYFPGIGRIPFEGGGSDNPLAFKVYDAGKQDRRQDHGRAPALRRLLLAHLHQCRPRSVRPGHAPLSVGEPARRWPPPRPGSTPPSSSSPSWACRTTASTTSTWRRTPRTSASTRRTSGTWSALAQGAPAGHRREAAVGHGQPVLAPALHEWRGDQSRLQRGGTRRGAGEERAGRHRGTGRRALRVLGRPRGLRLACTTPT